MAKFTEKMLKILIDGVEKTSGKSPDTVLVGSDTRAEEVRKALAILGRDFHVIADNELNPNSVLVCRADDLSKFAGGGRN